MPHFMEENENLASKTLFSTSPTKFVSQGQNDVQYHRHFKTLEGKKTF